MTTTIKVSDELRDRLKVQASRAGLTLGAHLSVLADAADRRERLIGLRTAIEYASSIDVESHLSESRVWETAELSGSEHG